MKGTTGPLQYLEGDFSISQKVKGGGVPGRGYYSNGAYHEEQGFGWQKNYTSSKLILPVTTKRGYHEVRVDRFFKDSVGRLTRKRRLKLEEARPDVVHIHKPEGCSYYEVDEHELRAWQKEAGL